MVYLILLSYILYLLRNISEFSFTLAADELFSADNITKNEIIFISFFSWLEPPNSQGWGWAAA